MRATVVTDDGTPQAIPRGGLTETIKFRSELDANTRQWQLSGNDIVEEMRHKLMGEIPNADPNAVDDWKKVANQLANEQGIGELCWILSNYLNKNMQLGYYKPEQIEIILIDFEGSLTRKFEVDFEWMGIRKEDLDQVFLTIANAVWSGYSRARFGGEKQFIEGTEQRMITSNESLPDSKKDGLWSKIPIIGKM